MRKDVRNEKEQAWSITVSGKSNPGNSYSHPVEINKGNKNAFVAAICLSMVYVLTEVIAGFALNSNAVLTNAIHNLADVASLVIL